MSNQIQLNYYKLTAACAEIVALVNEISAKSQTAVSVDNAGVTDVNAPPPSEYVPELLLHQFPEKAVVDLLKVASLSYNASLKAFPVVAVKLCRPFRISTLKTVTYSLSNCHNNLLWVP